MNAPNPQAAGTAVPGTELQTHGSSDLGRLMTQTFNPRDIMVGDTLDRVERMAKLMSTGAATVPDHFRNKPGDCAAIVLQAMSWNALPHQVAQKTYLLNGRLGYESQLIGAVLNSSGAIKQAALVDEYFGPWENVIGKVQEMSKPGRNPGDAPITWRKLASKVEDERCVGIRVSGTLRGESTPRTLELLLIQAGTRNSTLWADDPKQQLFYLAQLRWARKYAPGVILGMYSVEELETIDVHATEVGTRTPAPPPPPPAADPRAWTAEKFAGRMVAKWQPAVDKGESVDAILKFAEGVGPLTDEQRAKILALKPTAQATPAPTNAPTPAPTAAPSAEPTFGDDTKGAT